MDGPPRKKQAPDITQAFSDKIFTKDFQSELTTSITNSEPYRWGSITELFNDSLLRNVRKEVESQIHFTQKETDIYKVHQSGDLANLSGLNWDDLSRLPSLFKLREALYSQQFRDFISTVTQCGELSGVKTDMSINTYTKGCHLLTHDDVIGSRRVSFILYMPDPDKVWKEHYGGALRLFPAVIPNVPHTDYSTKLVPQFNQMAFFTVQPGLSFHDVEEVRVDKQRLSIQGWYHIPQRGERGFIEGEQEATEAKSTLQALESKELEEFDFPKEIRVPFNEFELKNYENLEKLDVDDLKYLQKFINEEYLEESYLKSIQEKFIDANFIELEEFLKPEYTNFLKRSIRDVELNEQIPNTAKDVSFPWKVSTPPHKSRYLYIDGKGPEENLTVEGVKFVNHHGPQENANFSILSTALTNTSTNGSVAKSEDDTKDSSTVNIELISLAQLFKSTSFKKFLTLLTDLIPTSDQILIRRFRQGHDFKLATSVNVPESAPLDCLLEATLCLTPSKGWESGDVGGYELSMTTDTGEKKPKSKSPTAEGDADEAEEEEDDDDDDPAIYKSSKQGDEDSVLLNTQASWNKLTLMIRDPSVLKFVKYVSFNAKGSRWDVVGQWDIKQKDGDDDEEEEEEEDEE